MSSAGGELFLSSFGFEGAIDVERSVPDQLRVEMSERKSAAARASEIDKQWSHPPAIRATNVAYQKPSTSPEMQFWQIRAFGLLEDVNGANPTQTSCLLLSGYSWDPSLRRR